MESFKIKVNPVQSSIVQKTIFPNGTWQVLGINVGRNDEYLFYYKKFNRITCSDTYRTFTEHENPEITFKEFVNKYVINSRVELTKEEQELVDSVIELPEKWAIRIINDEIVDYLNKYGKIPPYNINSRAFAHFPPFKDEFTTSDELKDGYTEITFEQFKKHVLKTETMKKEITGYKLRKPEYGGAASMIAIGNTAWVLGEIIYPQSKAVTKLKEAGVLDLWFEPIYKEKKKEFVILGHKVEFKDGVAKIGCQTIPYSTIIELAKIDEIMNIETTEGDIYFRELVELAKYIQENCL